MYKKPDARAKLVFCQSKPIFFPFLLPSSSSSLHKLSINFRTMYSCIEWVSCDVLGFVNR